MTSTRQQATAGHVAAGFDPVSFTAISADEFWLLGATPCAHPVCTSTVRTTDGGRHFVSIPAPHAAVSIGNDSTTSIDTLRFATAHDGFAFDAQSFRRGDGRSNPIWQTTDGGVHWRKTGLQHVLAFASGGGFVYVVTGRCTEGACRELTLHRLALGTSSRSSTALPVAPVDGLVELAAHAGSVWLSLTPTAGNDPYQVLLASTDNGKTFATERSPCTRGLGGEIAPSSESVLWAVCPTGMLAGALRSTDAGASWSSLAVGRGLSNSAQIAPASDTSAVLVPGGQSELLRTTDGGATFTTAYPTRSGFWSFVGFTDRETGTGLRILPGEARPSVGLPPVELVRSGDGGSTWMILPIG